MHRKSFNVLHAGVFALTAAFATTAFVAPTLAQTKEKEQQADPRGSDKRNPSAGSGQTEAPATPAPASVPPKSTQNNDKEGQAVGSGDRKPASPAGTAGPGGNVGSQTQDGEKKADPRGSSERSPANAGPVGTQPPK